MPSHSQLQAKTMSAIAHGWRPSGSAAKIPVKVAQEFHSKDAGHKYGAGMHGGKGKPYPKHNYADGGGVDQNYNTILSPQDESRFQSWKQQNAPKDTGYDYDLRGAYKSGFTPDPASGHWLDTYKKPWHSTFSDESKYATGANRGRAGFWTGPKHDIFVPPAPMSYGGALAIARKYSKRPRYGIGGPTDPPSDPYSYDPATEHRVTSPDDFPAVYGRRITRPLISAPQVPDPELMQRKLLDQYNTKKLNQGIQSPGGFADGGDTDFDTRWQDTNWPATVSTMRAMQMRDPDLYGRLKDKAAQMRPTDFDNRYQTPPQMDIYPGTDRYQEGGEVPPLSANAQAWLDQHGSREEAINAGINKLKQAYRTETPYWSNLLGELRGMGGTPAVSPRGGLPTRTARPPTTDMDFQEGGATDAPDYSYIPDASPELGQLGAGILTGIPRTAWNFVKSNVEAAKQPLGSDEYHEAIEKGVAPAITDVAMTMAGERPTPGTLGIHVGPFGASMLRRQAMKEGRPTAVHPVIGQDIKSATQGIHPALQEPVRGALTDIRDAAARGQLEMRRGATFPDVSGRPKPMFDELSEFGKPWENRSAADAPRNVDEAFLNFRRAMEHPESAPTTQGQAAVERALFSDPARGGQYYGDRDIFRQSGWHLRGGMPAKEISDVNARLRPVLDENGEIQKSARNGLDLYRLDHPAGDLHKAYDIPYIEHDPTGKVIGDNEGWHEPVTGNIITKHIKSSSNILHEMQHAIDKKEGYPSGLNYAQAHRMYPQQFKQEYFPTDQGDIIPPWQNQFGTEGKLQGNISAPTRAQFRTYQRSTGETGARNVQDRYAKSYRYLVHPEATEDIGRGLQITNPQAPRPRYMIRRLAPWLPEKDGGRTPSFQFGGGYKFKSNFNPEKAAAFSLARQGMIHSAVPGRTDKLNLNVPSGSYIIPADITSGMGQGNSMAGSKVLDQMFNKGPYGMNITKMKGGSPRMPRMSSLSKMSRMSQPGGTGGFGGSGGFADGGDTSFDERFSAAGEGTPQLPSSNVYTPEDVERLNWPARVRTTDYSKLSPEDAAKVRAMKGDYSNAYGFYHMGDRGINAPSIYSNAKDRAALYRYGQGLAPGGVPHNGQDTAPIVAAGGEYVVHPDSVRRLGGGDIDVGHDILDRFVKMQRDKHIKDLKGLKPPKGSDEAKGKAEGGGTRPWNRRTDTSARPWQRKYGTDEEAMAASQAQTKASQMREKELNASIRAGRDQPMAEFEENPTAKIDRLINKWQTGTIYGNEQDQLKQMLQERYAPSPTPAPRPVTSGIAVPIAKPSLQSAGAPLGPETQQARGGRLKLSKKSVQYTDHGKMQSHCGICKHFQKGHCAIVSGPIAAAGWCNRFAKK